MYIYFEYKWACGPGAYLQALLIGVADKLEDVMISFKQRLEKAKTQAEKRKIVEEFLADRASYVNNSLSDERAQGNVEFELDEEEWRVGATGAVCSGVDGDGAPFWRQADEIFNGDSSWRASTPVELIRLISKAVEKANVTDDSK